MATHWIITNRTVTDPTRSGGRHKVANGASDDDGELLASIARFRVARLDDEGLPRDADADAIERAVRFVPDVSSADYSRIRVGSPPVSLRGSSQMFKALYDDMRAACDAAPRGSRRRCDTLFVIHGFNYTWHASLTHLLRIIDRYVDAPDSNIGRVVYFSWPSWGSLRKYWRDQRIAAHTGETLSFIFSRYADFISEFLASTDHPGAPACGGAVHLMAHSMGNQVLEYAVRAMSERGEARCFVREALLLNADVEWQTLNRGGPLHTLPDFAKRTHVYNHESDNALMHSGAIKNPGTRRLGLDGPKLDQERPLAARTIIVDTSGLSGAEGNVPLDPAWRDAARHVTSDLPRGSLRERAFDHWGYLHRPEVINDVRAVLAGRSSSAIPGRTAFRTDAYRLRDRATPA
jgi:hypothetical protein